MTGAVMNVIFSKFETYERFCIAIEMAALKACVIFVFLKDTVLAYLTWWWSSINGDVLCSV